MQTVAGGVCARNRRIESKSVTIEITALAPVSCTAAPKRKLQSGCKLRAIAFKTEQTRCNNAGVGQQQGRKLTKLAQRLNECNVQTLMRNVAAGSEVCGRRNQESSKGSRDGMGL